MNIYRAKRQDSNQIIEGQYYTWGNIHWILQIKNGGNASYPIDHSTLEIVTLALSDAQKRLLILNSMLPIRVILDCAISIENSKHFLFLGLEAFEKSKSKEMFDLINYQMASIEKSIKLLEKRLNEARELLRGI